MILWSVVIDLCSFIRDIDSLGWVRVCAHTDVHSMGEDRYEEIRTLYSILLGSRGTADLDYIEI